MRLTLLIVAVVLGAASAAGAQGTAVEAMAKLNVVLPAGAEERLALSGAPEHLRAEAGVYVFGKQGYERVRAGSNGFTCLVNRDGFLYGAAAFKPTCWDAQGESTYVPVMLAVGAMLAVNESVDAIRAAIAAGFAGGQFHAPTSGGVAYMLAGDVYIDPATGRVTEQVFPGHYMFYAVGVTNAELGFTRAAAQQDPTLPFVFSAGAGGEHGLSYIIAVPGEAHAGAHSN